MMKGVCMLVCVGMHVRGSRLCDAKRNVCLPVGLSQGESCQTRVRLHVFVRAHLSLPNVLGCKEFQVHDSNVTLLLLLYFCLPRYHTLSHFHLILSTANAVFCPILASVTFHPFWVFFYYTNTVSDLAMQCIRHWIIMCTTASDITVKCREVQHY